MTGPTPLPDDSDVSTSIPARFHDVASSLAIAAEALSKAAQAMSAAARVMAEASQDFSVFRDLVGESMGEHHEQDNLTETSDDRASQASTGDLVVYDDDDDDDGLAVPKAVSSSPIAAPHDPSLTAPCSGGPMDISQIRFSPYPPPPDPQTDMFGTASSIIGAAGGGGDPHAAQAESHIATPSNGESSSLQESSAAYPKLPWGRNYIQLEEDFDAIPIISCMALASKKTICLVPTPESLGSYKKILSLITKLHVFLPMESNTPERVERALQALTSATSPAILLLAFQAIPYVEFEMASADCIIHWGWPENRQDYLKKFTLMKLHTRSCLILPSGDHLKPTNDSQPSNYGVVKYPDVVLSSYFGPEAPIHEIRKVTARVLADTDDDTMKALYHSWLDYYGMGSTRRGDWTVVNLMNYAREYAAKTLLRGPASDGSELYPPTSGKQLPIPAWVISAIDSIQPVTPQPAMGLQPQSETQGETSGQAQPGTNPTLRPGATSSLAEGRKIDSACFPTSERLTSEFARPGQYFVVLDEDFDATPFISYLGLKHQKTVCYIPSHESLLYLQKTFELISDLGVTRPVSMDDAQYAQAQLVSGARQLMLLQSYRGLQSAPLADSRVNAVVCWGYPENFDSDFYGGANRVARSYLILTPEEYARPLVQTNLSRFNVQRHPSSNRINDRGNCGLLFLARQRAREYIQKEEFSLTAYSLYHTFISYYSAGRGRPAGLTPEAIARIANRYAARVWLRGRVEDGSKRYPPVGDRPTLSPGAIRNFKLQDAQAMGLLN